MSSFNLSRAMFNQADLNQDGRIDASEFENWATGGTNAGAYYNYGLNGLSAYDAGILNNAVYRGNYGWNNGLYGGLYGYGVNTGLVGDASVYDSAAYYGHGGVYNVGNTVYDNSLVANTVAQTYPTDARGLYLDSNPTVIRRPNAQGVQTYTQNVRVRFLQPPPVPPHGPLIIREVRPPQPPVPAPLRIRQQAPPLPTPPPLVLREHPPRPPAVIPSQTVIRRLPGLPVPPRSVITERLPPLPPKPRDVVIERWVPYGPQARRRTVVQRAPPAVPYARPRNVIIQYEPAQARVVRQFHRLGVTPANPSAYAQTYGASLLDSHSLVNAARSAGIVEDISAPAVGFSGAVYGQNVAYDGAWGAGASVVDSGYVDGSWVGGAGWNGWNGANWGLNGAVVDGAVVDGTWAGGAGWNGWNGWNGLNGWTGSSASYYDDGWNGSYVDGAYGFDAVGAAFDNADVNRDGRIDRAEFDRFVAQGL